MKPEELVTVHELRMTVIQLKDWAKTKEEQYLLNILHSKINELINNNKDVLP